MKTSEQVPIQFQSTHPVETSEQVPIQFQSTHPVGTSEQVPIQFQSTHPIKHCMLDPVKGTCSDGFLGQSSAQPLLSQPIEHLPQGTITPRQGSGEEIAQALHQVISAPKVEYMRFDGNLMKYVSFMHNFETCLEKDNPDNSRRLQLLIQHCYGKTPKAIESCVNLPVEEGYYVAKNTLHENFGKPHIIAKAHVKKLENLPPLKQADGQSFLEFARHLDVAERTLTGMGPEYLSDLNHKNTLRELKKKLPLFMRVKWTECAGRIIEFGQRPRFVDFHQFLKQRAILVKTLIVVHQRTRRKAKAEMVGIGPLASLQQCSQVHAMIEALNTKARKEQMMLSKVVLSVPTGMVFGCVVNFKVYPIRRG